MASSVIRFGRGIYGDRFCGEGGHGLLLCVVGGYPYFRHGFLRPLFWYMLLAILVSLAGSVVVILYLAYEYGGINLSRWFFGGGTRAPFDYITTKLNVPTGFNLDGWGCEWEHHGPARAGAASSLLMAAASD